MKNHIITRRMNKVFSREMTTLLLWVKALNNARNKGWSDEEISKFITKMVRKNGKYPSSRQLARLLLWRVNLGGTK